MKYTSKCEMLSRRACSESGPHPADVYVAGGNRNTGTNWVGDCSGGGSGSGAGGGFAHHGHLWGKRHHGPASAPVLSHASTRPPQPIILRTRRSWPAAPSRCRSQGIEVGGTWSCCLPCAGGGGRGAPGGLTSAGGCGSSAGGSGGTGTGASEGNSPGSPSGTESNSRSKTNKSSIIVCHSNRRRQNQKSSITSVIKSTCKRSGSNNSSNDFNGELDDLAALDAAVEAVAKGGSFTLTKDSKDQHNNSEDCSNKDGNTQHRLSPRLHDIEEEDDEECRHTKESR
ncbi:loricrin [Microplitis demolitor]|uniref:loricrin n=1 Tax=Microplitis demolitor TaxID=69319 RepID=UPI00235B6D72|nr:loricrin [Microplitis demolitor]